MIFQIWDKAVPYHSLIILLGSAILCDVLLIWNHKVVNGKRGKMILLSLRNIVTRFFIYVMLLVFYNIATEQIILVGVLKGSVYKTILILEIVFQLKIFVNLSNSDVLTKFLQKLLKKVESGK